MKPVTDCANAEAVRLRQQLAERETQVTLLRDALDRLICMDVVYQRGPVVVAAVELAVEALAATEPITNYGDGPTRRRNADDMGNPPANAAELLNARKPKP